MQVYSARLCEPITMLQIMRTTMINGRAKRKKKASFHVHWFLLEQRKKSGGYEVMDRRSVISSCWKEALGRFIFYVELVRRSA